MFMHNGNVGAFSVIRRRLIVGLKAEAFDFAASRVSPQRWCGSRMLNSRPSPPITFCLPLLLLHAAQGGSDSAFCFALFLNQLDRYDEPLDADEMRKKLENVVVILNKVHGGLPISTPPHVRTAHYNPRLPPYATAFPPPLFSHLNTQYSKAAEEEGIQASSMLNFVLTDGYSLVATRYLRDPLKTQVGAATLYFASGTNYHCVDGMKARREHEQERTSRERTFDGNVGG
jgi:hypothetical protein